ncbi:hypothetical protein Tco_0300023 [Tanacetum coccineum]
MFPMTWGNGHKGLIEAIKKLLPHAEHRLCTTHIYANFKKKLNGLHYKSLFCGAYPPLPSQDCAAFENGISESYHSAIGIARTKPIISMLEEIRVVPCGQQLLEVRKANEMFRQTDWVDVYSHFIKPVGGSSIWVKSENPPPLPPRRGLCQEKGHNKARCYNQTRLKPQQEKRKPGRKSQQAINQPFNPPNTDPSSADLSFADPSSADPSAANPSFADPSFADPSSADPSAVDPSSADPSLADPNAADLSFADPNQSFTGILNCVEQHSMGVEIVDAEIALALA